MRSISTVPVRKSTTLRVAVKCRPLLERENGRNIVRVADQNVLFSSCQIYSPFETTEKRSSQEVIVLDPDLSKDYLDLVQNRTKEKTYHFDYAFPPNASNSDVYKKCICSVISGVVHGLNATVFAYGSTGSGKTHTMVGNRHDPGLMALSLNTIFDLIKAHEPSDEFDVSCSYLEVYNEVIYDLLERSSGHLELREDSEQGIRVHGLKSIKVKSADKILELLNVGNSRRKTESTEANRTSSRSHAVLEIKVRRKQRKNEVLCGKLSLVDLAGSERASETNSVGRKMRDGANINQSLLALANCINAVGKHRTKGLVYVPYRNSKLTRILKDGLSGNSQTIMVATVSPSDAQYHHTVNTLKYASRAKEIKTHIHKNVGTVDTHASEYERMIENLRTEVSRLETELAQKAKPVNELNWLNLLSRETTENVQERINLQKALFELEEMNVRNRVELEQLDESIASEREGAIVEALRARRQVILDTVRDNDEAGVGYRDGIETNEKQRHEIHEMIEEAMSKDENKTYLGILRQYRVLGMANTELQFEMARRDQIIHHQRESHKHLWNLIRELGPVDQQLANLATKRGLRVEAANFCAFEGRCGHMYQTNARKEHRFSYFSSRVPWNHPVWFGDQPAFCSTPEILGPKVRPFGPSRSIWAPSQTHPSNGFHTHLGFGQYWEPHNKFLRF